MSDVGSHAARVSTPAPGSTSALPSTLASTLEIAFGPHLESICARSAQALAASGFGALLVHSGSLLMIFEDDQPHSFQVNAAFKVWVPISDVPDSYHLL